MTSSGDVGAGRALRRVAVRSLGASASRGHVVIGWQRLPCALGRGGRRAGKREGDGATPMGRWRPLRVLYRADRVPRPRTTLPVRPIRPDDGWCDAASDRNYNRRVRHPYAASAEHLWRADGLYDIVVVLDHNQRPRSRGRGSAIFMHVATAGLSPTAGCIALGRRDLEKVLAWIGPVSRILIPGGPAAARHAARREQDPRLD